MTNSPNFNANELVVIPNMSTPGGAAVTFAAARTVANSNFAGTPVGGNQGVATGDLSHSFHAGFNDIAVVYAAGGRPAKAWSPSSKTSMTLFFIASEDSS